VNVLVQYLGRRGGGARYALETARALAAPGSLVHLLLAEDNELLEDFLALGLPVVLFNPIHTARQAFTKLACTARDVARVHGYVRREAIDAIYVPMWHPADLLFLRLAAPRGVPALLTVHDVHFHSGEAFPAAERLLHAEIRAVAGLLTLSRFACEQLDSVQDAAPRRWTTPHPVPTTGGEVRGRPRRLPVDRPVRLLLPGRMVRYKGIEVFLEVVAVLRADPAVAVRGVLAGEGPGLTEEVREQAARVGVEVKDGWLTEAQLEEEIATSDVVVLPYRDATQSGLVPLAQAFGVPVVVTDVGALPEQVRHEIDGLVAAGTTTDRVVAAVRRLLGDAELYERCSTGALQAATRLSWTRSAADVRSALAALLTPS
jgi:glycosyltransferase involved in cell wall biosynthesis